jgi:hypothetical protein
VRVVVVRTGNKSPGSVQSLDSRFPFGHLPKKTKDVTVDVAVQCGVASAER